jgi:hypothetical protein
MKSIFGMMAAAILLTGCPAKKTDPETETRVDKDSVEAKIVTEDREAAASLDELIYEARGASLLKKESLARSQAELKGRVELIKTLAADAGRLVAAFAKVHPQHFAKAVDAGDYASKISAFLEKETTLKGSRISEYGEEADTTFATVEISLMNGYDVIEKAVVEVGRESGYLQESSVSEFKKTFKAFFLEEKKKLLTPSA